MLCASWQTQAQPAPKYFEVDQFFSVTGPDSLVSMSWKEDRLWLGLRNGDYWQTISRSIQALDLDSLTATGKRWDFKGPGPFAEGPLGEGGFFTHVDGSLYILMPGGKIRGIEMSNGRERILDASLPPEVNPMLIASGHSLFLLSPDRILELDPRSERIQILASKRRHPAVSDLDAIDWKGNPQIITDEAGNRSLLLPNQFGYETYRQVTAPNIWTNTGKRRWELHNVTRTTDGNFLLQGGTLGSTDIRLQTSTNVQTLFTTLRAVTGRWGNNSMVPDIFGVAGKMAGTLGPSDAVGRSTWDGTNLWALAAKNTLEMSPYTNPPFKVSSRSTNAQAVLWYFNPRWQYPIELPLRFSQTEKFKAFHDHLKQNGVPRILATPKGLLIMMTPLQGFWFIPKEKLDQWTSEAEKNVLLQPNSYLARLAQFDTNHNGILDDDEAKIYSLSDAYRLEISSQKARELIAQFDINMDGALDEEEVWRAYRQNLVLELALRYMVTNLPREDHRKLMEIADKNKDGKLDVSEMAQVLLTGRIPGLPLPAAGSRTNTTAPYKALPGMERKSP